jgi:putative addiction module CopG family antidote
MATDPNDSGSSGRERTIIRVGLNPAKGGRHENHTADEITLPNETAEFVREKVARGDYASDGEVLRDALRALRERDRATMGHAASGLNLHNVQLDGLSLRSTKALPLVTNSTVGQQL